MTGSTFSFNSLIVLVVVASLITFSLLRSMPTIFAEIGSSGDANSSMISSQNSNVTTLMNNTMMNNLDSSPLIVEHEKSTSSTNINQNTTAIFFEGNATVMLPVGNVSVSDEGSAIIKSMQGFSIVLGQRIYKTNDGQGSATINFTGYLPNNSKTVFGIAYIQPNSVTGQRLAPLNNTIAIFKEQLLSPTKSIETYWKWK